MIFHILTTDPETDQRNVVVFVPGQEPKACDDSHPNFDAIVASITDGSADETVLDLFDLGDTVAKRFEGLSERVSVANGHVYFDGDEVDNALTKQIVRFLDEDESDWWPLVAFFENVQQNPQEHSRTQLYEWLERHDFTIDESGDIIAYKGVTEDLKSIHSGPAIVDGEAVNGQVPNAIGSVIEMPRSSVTADPSIGCHVGLHVGTFDYASTFGRGKCLKVAVNPRDVVSVPTDCNAQKVRCCRYRVIDVIDAPVPSGLDRSEYADDDDWEDDDYYDDYCDCGCEDY